MIKAHSIKLNPTPKQRQLFTQASGCKRKAYNWALSEWNKWKEEGKSVGAMSLVKHLNSIKKTEFPYFQDVSKTATQYAVWDLCDGWTRYFKGLKDGSIAKAKTAYINKRKSKGLPINEGKLKNFGKPKFKKKGKAIDSFVAVENNNAFKQSNFKIHIPRVGKVKCFENLRFEGKVNNVVVKRIANDWFAIINVDTLMSVPLVSENQATIGIDIGINKMMVCSDGSIYENPKSLRIAMKGIKRMQRSLSRKVKGSNNRFKQSRKLAVKHQKVVNIRKNAIHQATTEIIKKGYGKIVIEDLNVQGMIANHKLAQSIGDVSFGEIKRQLSYKAQWNGVEMVKADRWFPSSKLCSNCSNKKEKLSLSERVYKCENCGLKLDRDLNAAINLANYSPTPSVGESEACGEVAESRKTQSRSKKHEINKFGINNKQLKQINL